MSACVRADVETACGEAGELMRPATNWRRLGWALRRPRPSLPVRSAHQPPCRLRARLHVPRRPAKRVQHWRQVHSAAALSLLIDGARDVRSSVSALAAPRRACGGNGCGARLARPAPWSPPLVLARGPASARHAISSPIAPVNPFSPNHIKRPDRWIARLRQSEHRLPCSRELSVDQPSPSWSTWSLSALRR